MGVRRILIFGIFGDRQQQTKFSIKIEDIFPLQSNLMTKSEIRKNVVDFQLKLVFPYLKCGKIQKQTFRVHLNLMGVTATTLPPLVYSHWVELSELYQKKNIIISYEEMFYCKDFAYKFQFIERFTQICTSYTYGYGASVAWCTQMTNAQQEKVRAKNHIH